MICFTTSWHRKFGLFIVAVCLCWSKCVARQKVLAKRNNELATQPTPHAVNSTTTRKRQEETEVELTQPKQTSGILNLGCQGIRIRRYVSNGFCTSRRPFRDVICDGQCMAMDQLPLFPQFSKIISRHKREWRCVPDEVRRRKVTVLCNDGTKHKYRVRIVRSCKCKRYTHKQNQTNP